ncbi:hypothetical protein [Bradyrhizobium sp. SYSU BS000235]|uniref:hypothetical protein n=1 Tax=Bradyrhizobium sp. SYSU BS000235 TaxID=3411332 RepID=UPI003C795B52
MIKTLSAIAAAAAIGAAITFSPGLAPEVEASQTTTIAKTAEPPAAKIAAVDARCANQAWPNIDAACLRGSDKAPIQPVRVITTDRR